MFFRRGVRDGAEHSILHSLGLLEEPDTAQLLFHETIMDGQRSDLRSRKGVLDIGLGKSLNASLVIDLKKAITYFSLSTIGMPIPDRTPNSALRACPERSEGTAPLQQMAVVDLCRSV